MRLRKLTWLRQGQSWDLNPEPAGSIHTAVMEMRIWIFWVLPHIPGLQLGSASDSPNRAVAGPAGSSRDLCGLCRDMREA